MDTADNSYAELLEAGLPDQVCVTWCQVHDLEEVARRFGAEVGSGVWTMQEDIEDLVEDHSDLLQLAKVGEWTVALEPDGFQGSRQEILESLSRGGRALSIFWNVELDNDVVYAVDGRIVTTFDLMDIAERAGSDPAALDEVLAEVGLHNELPAQARKARVLALGEKISGQLLTPHWLQSPQLTFTITDPLPDPLIPSAYLNPREPFLDEPEFARILAAPSADMAPTIVGMVISIVVDTPDLQEPLVQEALRLLDHGERVSGERESLRSRLVEQAAENVERARLLRFATPNAVDEARRLERECQVFTILRRALNPSPVEAAHNAAERASTLRLPNRTDVMRLTVLRNVMERIEYDLRRS